MKSILITAALAIAANAAPATRTNTVVLTEVLVVNTKGAVISTSTVDPTPTTEAGLQCTTFTGRSGVIRTRCASSLLVVSTSFAPAPSVSSSFAPPQPEQASPVAVVQATAPVAKQPTTPTTPGNVNDFLAPILPDSAYGGSGLGPGWARNVLAHTNIHRYNHSVPMLQWSPDLANAAYQLSSSCIWAHTNKYGSGNWSAGSYMNNLVTTRTEDYYNAGTFISEAFYNGEYDYYVMASNNFSPSMKNPDNSRVPAGGMTGHLSQLLWKSHTHVGCAVFNCDPKAGGPGIFDADGKAVGGVQSLVTCNYGPPGNMGGEYAENVPPPNNKISIVGPAQRDVTGDLPTAH